MTEAQNMPPIAAKRDHQVASPHGARSDPYYWLRDDERRNPAVLAYLDAENAYHGRYLAPAKALEDAVYEEIMSRLQQDDSTVPYLKNDYWYYVRFESGHEHPLYARRQASPQASEEIMLNANEHSAAHPFYQVGEIEVSPDSNWLAYCEDIVGRREYRLRFKNLATSEILEETIDGVEADIAWANDSKTLLYVEKDPETLLGVRVKAHVLGSDPGSDRLIFEQTDKSFYTGVTKSKSDRFLFIHLEGTVISEWHYADADDPALKFKIFLPREQEHEYEVEHLGDRFIVRSNRNARNFRIMSVPIGREGCYSEWRELAGHRDDVFIEEFDICEDFLILSVRTAGLRKIAVRPMDRGVADEFFIASDEPAYTMALSANPDISSRILRYSYSSLATPTTIYDHDLDTGERRLLKQDPVLGGFNSTDYMTEFLFVPSRDGTKIPVSLIYRKGLAQDGSAPMLQYAYGSYGLSMDPTFSSPRFSLIDRGFIYAIAHIRGGQEMGREWYDEGRLLHKKNSFTDFIDVTRFLVAQRYCHRDKVFAMGGSAGGLLMGAIANMSPGDYRGIVAQVPFVDTVTTMLDDSIPLTTNEYDEWGDPADRAFYDYMLSYSPYDNVTAQEYPAMLITTGLWDSQVQYYEPAKWVAKLRSLKTDQNVLLFHVDMDAGHGGKAGRFQRYRETAMEFAFILAELKPAPEPRRRTPEPLP